MKTIILRRTLLAIALVWFLAYQACAQLKLEGHSVTLQADTITVKEAFKILSMIPLSMKVNKIVIKDGKEWYQTRWLFNRMMKRWAYTEVNGKVKLIRI